MSKASVYAEIIRERVGIRQAMEQAGIHFNSRGSACCPFHQEKTGSFKVKGRFGHCFGCGWNGNVIDFTVQFYGLPFIGAVEKLNRDFGLGLPIDRPLTRQQRAEIKQRQAEAQRRQNEQREYRELYAAVYDGLWSLFAKYDKAIMERAPTSPDEPFDPLFCEAVKNIDSIKYAILDEL